MVFARTEEAAGVKGLSAFVVEAATPMTGFAAADVLKDIETFRISHLCGTNDAIRDIHELMPVEARPRDGALLWKRPT